MTVRRGRHLGNGGMTVGSWLSLAHTLMVIWMGMGMGMGMRIRMRIRMRFQSHRRDERAGKAIMEQNGSTGFDIWRQIEAKPDGNHEKQKEKEKDTEKETEKEKVGR